MAVALSLSFSVYAFNIVSQFGGSEFFLFLLQDVNPWLIHFNV